jgi:Fur family ferric uptake transcriptional regulator
MALDSIEGSLKERGVRLTRQRQILLELIDKTGEHLDAESLFQLAKEKDPKLNRVTVYRTLKMLKAGGLVDELDLMHYGGDQHYYETRLKQEHAHVICLRCGKVEEFFGEPLQRLRKQIESHFGFQVLLARTEVGGYCAHCQTLRAREVEELRRLTLGSEKPTAEARTPRKRPRRARCHRKPGLSRQRGPRRSSSWIPTVNANECPSIRFHFSSAASPKTT